VRKVQIWGHSSFYFGGLRVTAADSVFPTPRAPKCIVISDSYGDGAGDGYLNYHQVVSRVMGWDTICAAVGSTGYLSTNGGLAMKFRDRIVSDLYPFDCDVVLLEGGVNDIPGAPVANTWTQADLEAEAALTWRAILDNKPDALLIVVGPMRGSSGNANAYPSNAMDTGFQAKAATFGEYGKRLFYLPTITDPAGAWVFGNTTTGNFSSTPAVYGSSDGTHLLEPGQEYLGRRVTTSLVNALASAS
jgi:lysophospholipase L1-like esterase